MGKIKRVVIITIATALFTSQLAGCSDNNKESLQKIETASSKSQNQQNQQGGNKDKDSSSEVVTTLPGEDIAGAIGEPVVYKDSVTVSFDRVHEVGKDGKGSSYYVFVFTIKNDTPEHITVKTIYNFELYNQDKLLDGALLSSRAATNALRAIKDISVFKDMVLAGTTMTGYIYAEAPSDFTEMKVSFYPNKEKTGDTISFSFTRDDISPIN